MSGSTTRAAGHRADVRRDALPELEPHAAQSGWRGELALGFAFDAPVRRTRLANVRHVGPLVVQRPLYPEGAAICHAIVVHPPGGIAGGDELSVDVSVASRAHAVLTTPGATKLYKSVDRPAGQAVRLVVEREGTVEWLPQEAIVFDRATATLSLHIDVARDGCALAWDIVTLGREAMGERYASGRLDMSLEVTLDGAAVVLERGRIDGGSRWLDSPVGWRGARTCGTFVAVGRHVDDGLRDACRRALEPWPLRAAVSRLSGECLVARYVGPAATECRAAFEAVRAMLRPAWCGVPAQPLRIWAT